MALTRKASPAPGGPFKDKTVKDEYFFLLRSLQ